MNISFALRDNFLLGTHIRDRARKGEGLPRKRTAKMFHVKHFRRPFALVMLRQNSFLNEVG